MRCPFCGGNDTKVIDSRVIKDRYSVRRRRECLKCKARFSTKEELEILDLTVIKRDGSREPYQREKLILGIKKALEKRPFEYEEFWKLIKQIEIEIQSYQKPEIKSSKIGEIVMKYLKKFDKVAYVRFASVYKNFEDISEFKKEIDKLKK